MIKKVIHWLISLLRVSFLILVVCFCFLLLICWSFPKRNRSEFYKYIELSVAPLWEIWYVFHLPLIFPSFLRFHLCAITQGKQTVALRCHITHIRLNVGPLCIAAIRFSAMRIGLLYKVMIVQRFGKLDGLGFSDRFLHNFHDDVSKMLPDCVCVCCLCVFVCCVYLWQFLMCNCTVQSASFGERLSLLR